MNGMSAMGDAPPSTSTSLSGERLAAFHAGDRSEIEACYREHVGRVLAAARRIVGSVDAETITHEVFYRLLSNAKMRESFQGGNLGAWLTQVVTRSAVDDLRRRKREVAHAEEPMEEPTGVASSSSASAPSSSADTSQEHVDAKLLIDRFRRERLPPEWAAVFDARFIRQLPQREAARALGMPRTTLVYQEQKVRALLQRFLLGGESEQHR